MLTTEAFAGSMTNPFVWFVMLPAPDLVIQTWGF